MFKVIDGTNYLGLWGDKEATVKCCQKNRLDWDDDFKNGLMGCSEFTDLLEEKKFKRIAIDVGAFIGDATKFFIDCGFIVFAFESDPFAYHCLAHNCPEAICRNMAIGDGSNASEVGFIQNGNFGSRYLKKNHTGNIKTFPLDFLNVIRIDLVKIDVEGFEPFVLDGMKRIMMEFRPILIIEINRKALKLQGVDEESIYNRIPNFYKRKVITYPERVFTEDGWDILCYPG